MMPGKLSRQIRSLTAKDDTETPRPDDMQKTSVQEWFPLAFLILTAGALLISYSLVHGFDPNVFPLQQVTEIVKTVGLICAGAWTAWTFYRLQTIRAAELANNKTLIEIEKNRVDIEKTREETYKTRLEIEKTRVDVVKSRVDTEKTRADIAKNRVEQDEIKERIRSQQPQLAIQLEVSESASPNPTYKSILAICVVVKNEGSQPLSMNFNQSSLTMGRLEFHKNRQKNRQQRFAPVIQCTPKFFQNGKLTPFNFRLLRAGQARRMALALVPITTLGSYLIQFSVSYVRAQLEAYNGEKEEMCRDNIAIEAVEQMFYIATGRAPERSTTLAVQSHTNPHRDTSKT
jgi:hypothetical protein